MPGLKIYTGNRLEILAAKLAGVLGAQDLSAFPLSQEIIIVQSKGMERWISMELAKHNRICANCRFPFPNSFLDEVLKHFFPDMPGSSLFEPGVMTFRLMKILPARFGKAGFESLTGYLNDDTGRLKLFQLSERISGLFDQYIIFRPDMIFMWEEGREVEDEPHAWQAELWRELTLGNEKYHRAYLQRALVQKIRRLTSAPDDFFGRISVFGISSLPRFHMQVIEELSRITEVNIFFMNPCREYWADTMTEKGAGSIRAKYAPGSADAEDLHLETGNRLLSSMGELGRTFFEYLVSSEHELAEDFKEEECRDLLSCIKSDILNFKSRNITDKNAFSVSGMPDYSLQFHSCHSPMRETEALHDNLLAMFEDDPGLLPNDILVMAPDIGIYAPFVHAVFDSQGSGEPRIPFSVSDRSVRKESGVIDGFLSILDLKKNRFRVSKVVSLMEYPGIKERFGLSESDAGKIRGWVKDARIRWGLDGDDKITMGLPGIRENTWKAGMERFLLGYAMPGGDGRTFSGILPFEGIEGTDAQVLGKFLEFLERIFVTAESLEGFRRMNEWHSVLSAILDAFFVSDDETGRHVRFIRNVLGKMLNDAERSGYDGELGIDLVKYRMKKDLEHESSISGFMSGGVTFCSMLPMRSIPFKVICLLGMNNDAFPGKSGSYGFDLIANNPRPGDRSKKNDDKYIFLEALISARKIFYVSYVGQSIQDNTQAPPSVLVSELLDYVREGFGFGPDRMIIRHKLQAFSKEYFKESGQLFSYSPENMLAAQSLSESGHKFIDHVPFITDPLTEPSEELKIINLESLCGFFSNPAKYLLTKRLGIYLEEKDAVLSDREDFDLGSLDRYLVNQDLVSDLEEGKTAGDYLLDAYRAEGRLPHGRAGEIFLNESVIDAGIYVKKLDEFTKGDKPSSYDADMAINGFSLTGRLTNIYDGGMLCFRYAAMKTRDILRAWIYHLVLCSYHDRGLPLNTYLVCTDKTVKFNPVEKNVENLAVLFDLYREGLSRPLHFFPELSHEFAEQAHKRGKGKNEAVRIIEKKWHGSDYARGVSKDPYYDLCFRNTGTDGIFDDQFIKNSEAVFIPLLDHLSES
ncbi:MAG: exodeoxyribonuclease V subunit gamma [Desulfobacteraceae bacterium]|nr:MAG: exodeoxyribonuclease V subunit gamma [Desulfobacteraceae bacterium]